MTTDDSRNDAPPVSGTAIRRHLGVVILLGLIGALGGWWYAGSAPQAYTSTARVLVNPAAGNPFVPTPTAVRQDEMTSMETEAQVARSAEVLGAVAVPGAALSTSSLQTGLRITVPPNTQILELTFTSADPALARKAANAIATAYLENRSRRFEELNLERIERVAAQTDQVLGDLRAATTAARQGPQADRAFQAELAAALRNELVSLRAQRTALESSEAPAGAVVSPASSAEESVDLVVAAAPVGGALGGLALGCLLALAWDRLRRVVVSVDEVERTGVPVLAIAPASGGPRLLRRRRAGEGLDVSVRRMRAAVLDADPRPTVVALATAEAGDPGAGVADALAVSLSRAGHPTVLVRTAPSQGGQGLEVEAGLAEMLEHERLNVLEMLRPTVEPLLCVLPGGDPGARRQDLLLTEGVRTVLGSLVDSGNLVVVQSPALASPEGESVLRAASLGVVTVTLGRTRRRALQELARICAAPGAPPMAVLVLGRHDVAHPVSPVAEDQAAGGRREPAVATHRRWAPARR